LDESLLEKSPFDLSGGEKRRAAIAGVMAMEPEVLILDEPTAGLDPRGREQVLAMIQDYRKTRGTTVLLVTHSMEDVARVADRILVMSEGRVAMLDTVEAVFSRAEELEAIGLTVPAVTKTLLLLQRRGVAVDTAAYTVEAATAQILSLLGGDGV
jgi:energy-coupling factor transport system ATP-binding protein